MELIQRSGRDVTPGKSNRGQVPSKMKVVLGLAFYSSGISNIKGIEMCAEAGLVCPSKKSFHNTRNQVREAVKTISTAQLQDNQRKHIKAC